MSEYGRLDLKRNLDEKTNLRLTNRYGEFSVTVFKEDMSLGDLIEELVHPVLVAAGYSDGLVEDYLYGEGLRGGDKYDRVYEDSNIRGDGPTAA